MVWIRKKFGIFEFEMFTVEDGWSYNWMLRIKNIVTLHIAWFRRRCKWR